MPSNIPTAYYDTVFVLQGRPDPLPSAFAIITAFNPMDEVSPPSENEAADQRLKMRLVNSGLEFFRATGSSPDISHSELGWSVVSSLDDALEIARSFNQRALWWIEGEQLYLVDCGNPLPLPVARFSERVLTS